MAKHEVKLTPKGVFDNILGAIAKLLEVEELLSKDEIEKANKTHLEGLQLAETVSYQDMEEHLHIHAAYIAWNHKLLEVEGLMREKGIDV